MLIGCQTLLFARFFLEVSPLTQGSPGCSALPDGSHVFLMLLLPRVGGHRGSYGSDVSGTPPLIVRAFLTAQQKKAALRSQIHSSAGPLTLSPFPSLQLPPCQVPMTTIIVLRLACSQLQSQGLLV